ncbi:DeoR/GlpR family DNA-binding transcription regulator [Microbacterium sp. DT81.1]|uniref:DeoR/GlpR family DNA-binding transcription regulator n=1 Tax=Microbacterium sp. DT81.1 TaxID=3393413 RepID=UPI003CEB44D7
MYATERQGRIAEGIATQGRVSVVELASSLGVTTETIRRDLDALENAGLLRRVHGGAIAPRRASLVEPSLDERFGMAGTAKAAIAARALEMIGRGYRGAVLIDAGSTTGALATLLPGHVAENQANVDVVTHAVPIAHVLSAVPGIDLTVVGGQVRGLTAAAVGASTVHAIENLRPDLAFVGVNGISADFGLSTPDPGEAAVKSAIVRGARRVVVLADSSKFGVESLVRFGRLEDVDILVTDENPDAALARTLDEAGVEVWLA